MAHKKTVNEWEAVFKHFDKDNSKTLDIKEMRDMLKANDSNLTNTQIAEAFIFFDGPSGDRAITLEEFTKGMQRMSDVSNSMKAFFHECDKDNSGFLDHDETKTIILKAYPNMPNHEVEGIIKEADTDNDGKLSLDEFLNAVN